LAFAADTPAAAARIGADAHEADAGEAEAQQRSFVLNCSHSSLLQKRKALYDAMVQLEQQQHGLVLVERAMPHPDVIMTPAVGLCIWGEHNLQVGQNDITTKLWFWDQTVLRYGSMSSDMGFDAVFDIRSIAFCSSCCSMQVLT
jgi:hypothetical protein